MAEKQRGKDSPPSVSPGDPSLTRKAFIGTALTGMAAATAAAMAPLRHITDLPTLEQFLQLTHSLLQFGETRLQQALVLARRGRR